MRDHIDAWIPDLVLGTLDGTARSEVDLHLESCARCAGEVAEATAAFSEMALSLPPVRPQPSVFTDLLASIAEREPQRQGCSAHRFVDVIDQVARLFDLTAERVKTLLGLVDEPTAWRRGKAEGITLLDFRGGPAIAGADAGFVRMLPGVTFPYHRHMGGEAVLVIEGSFVGDDGTVVRRGEGLRFEAETRHAFTAREEGCLFAVVIWEGLDFDQTPPGVAS
jgi:putative transcriptional regulator